jgi:tRNA A-37 threonylcarbamoyl transferase component Bud32
MQPPPPADDQDLARAAEAALGASRARTLVFEHAGERYVAKRDAQVARGAVPALLARWLARRVTGAALPMGAARLGAGASAAGFEARRLGELAAAGMRVPRVVHRGAGFIVMEHCGVTVASLLGGWDRETRWRELAAQAAELGVFHRAGQWHGGAQIKNLTRKEGQTWRIDFEETFGEHVPLPAAQAFDVVLFLNSISLRGPVDEAEARSLLPALMQAYLDANPDPEVRAVFVRALPWARAAGALASPLRRLNFGGRRRNGAARLGLLAQAIDAALTQSRASAVT